jgi:hypothetical protein
VVHVGLRLGEGLEVACVGVADDVCGDGIACFAGIAWCVLYWSVYISWYIGQGNLRIWKPSAPCIFL